jgi:hypothetical protein
MRIDYSPVSTDRRERKMNEILPLSLVYSYVNGSMTRAQLLKVAVAAGLTSAAIPDLASAQGAAASQPESFPFFPQTLSGRYTTESIDDIVSNILTWAAFEVSAGTLILSTPPLAAQIGVASGLPRTFLEAFVVELQLQYDFWASLVPNAQPKVTTFTVDPGLVPNAAASLMVIEVAATVRTAMMITAVREFAELGQPVLAKYAAQTEGMYAEERAIARMFQALGGNAAAAPPNNKAFETDLFLYTRDAVAVLYGLGFINGKGIPVPYPGRAATFAAAGSTDSAVIQRTPNNATTSVSVSGLPSLTGERA